MNTGHNDTWETLKHEVITCRRCPRLVAWREEVAQVKRRAYRDFEYWGKPVPGFGDHQARLLLLGLAPGAHGSNRTGRMFTGDASGDFLFPALHRAGFANQPEAIHRGDDLRLNDAYITAVGRCAPPDNKPTAGELQRCRPFLERELALLSELKIVLALGKIAFDGYVRWVRDQGYTVSGVKFGHGVRYALHPDLPLLMASYHPSQQNTQTGRLTVAMFDGVFEEIKALL